MPDHRRRTTTTRAAARSKSSFKMHLFSTPGRTFKPSRGALYYLAKMSHCEPSLLTHLLVNPFCEQFHNYETSSNMKDQCSVDMQVRAACHGCTGLSSLSCGHVCSSSFCVSPPSLHHKACACKHCEHKAEEIGQTGAGAAGGGKGSAGGVADGEGGI